MKSPGKCSSYLIQNAYSYCFRMKVPPDLRQVIGRKELRYSLRTGYLGKAKFKARILAGQVQQLFAWVRKGGAALSGLSDEKIQELIQQYLKKAVEGLESRYYDEEFLEYPPWVDDRTFLSYIDGLDIIKRDVAKDHAKGEYSSVKAIAADLLIRSGIVGIEEGSVGHIKLCRGIQLAQLEEIDIEKRYMLGDHSGKEASPRSPSVALPIPAEKTSELLDEVIAKYWEENERAGNWAERTKVDYQTSANLIKKILGNPPIHFIDSQVMRNFKETLLNLPAFLNSQKYQGKSISEILRMNIQRRLSTTTINKYLIFAHGLFDYAVDNTCLEKNPAVGLVIPQKKRGKKREEFSHDDLIKLFNSDAYVNDKHNESYKFWLPILGLFTGCRIEELCQLYTENVRQEDGIWLLDITEEVDEDEDEKGDGIIRKVKSQQSNRLVPLHPMLVKLRFPEHVKRLREKGQERVFPELKKIQHRYSHYASRWFSTFRKKCGITEKKKAYHSFRHTFITHLVKKQVNERMRHQVEGHLLNDITQEYTGTNVFTPKDIYKGVISKIDYGIDFSHLKKSKFVKH